MKDIPGIDENGEPKNVPFKLYFKNGLVSCQGEFNNGKKSGKWKYFLNNGQLWDEGQFEHGKKRGIWKVYDEAGAYKEEDLQVSRSFSRRFPAF